MSQTIVETVSLRINPLEGEKKQVARNTIVACRYIWNWLVAMDKPIFEQRAEMWRKAMDRQAAEGIEGDKAIKAAAKELKGEWPEFPSKKVKVKDFFSWVETEEKKVWLWGEKFPRRPLYATQRKYNQTRDSALGRTSKGQARKGGKGGKPRFQPLRKDKESSIAFQVQDKDKETGKSAKAYTSNLIDRNNKRVRLPQPFGFIRFRDECKVLDNALAHHARTDSIRLCRERDKWRVVFDVTYEAADVQPAKGKIGLDMGVTIPVADSNGKAYGEEMVKRIRKLEKRKALLQKKISRSYHMAAKEQRCLNETGGIKKGSRVTTSNRYKEKQRQLFVVTQKITRARKSWAAQTASLIAQENGFVAIEDLKTSNMTKSASGTLENPGRGVKSKKTLNREILARGWNGLRLRLDHATFKRGGKLVAVNPAYTSQKCRGCGHISPENRDKTKFKCVSCGHTGHADHEAARNILDKALG